MTVTPHRQLLVNSFEAIVELLSANRHHPLVSLSFQLPRVDPLLAVQTLSPAHQPYFYWEHGERAMALLGLTIAQEVRSSDSVTGASSDRFAAAQAFIQATISSMQILGKGRTMEPRFYCRFPFFEQTTPPATPFASSQVCLPQWQIYRHQSSSSLVVNLTLDRTADIAMLAAEISTVIAKLTQLEERVFTGHPPQLSLETDLGAVDRLKTAIVRSLDLIDRQELQKIVLAHSCLVTAPTNFSIPHCLHNLRQHHPDCYTFAIHDGLGNYFLGASPERLVSVSDRQLICDVLAGSAPRSQSAQEDTQLAQQLIASSKEQHEHQLVRNFMIGSLQHLGLKPQWNKQPQLLSLTNIQHVWTPIRAALSPHIHPLTVVAALHPTPAVAGLPRELACAKIQEYETVARSLYAAPIGWIDTAGNCELVVGIRSAMITGNQARLFAGAGIVAGSQVEREVAEIQLKFQSLYQALSS